MAERAPRQTVPFARPDIDDRDVVDVVEVLRGGWLTSGPQCGLFEEELKAKVGARHAVATNSCTAALHLALAALGGERGDAVLTSTYNFTSTAAVAQHLGLEPVLVDAEPHSLNLDPEALARALDVQRRRQRRVLAIVPMHLSGHPSDLEAIDRLADEHSCEVVEDAAHALPSAYDGRPIGSRRASGHPRAVCFSFYANKTLTTGEGGMLVTDDGALAERCRRLGRHGLDSLAWGREKGAHGAGKPPWRYEVVEAGFKYNLGDMAAALGRSQLRKVDAMAARRRQVAERYSAAFEGRAELQVPASPIAGSESSWHLYLLRFDLERFARPDSARDRLAAALARQGIGTSVHYRPLHLHQHYQESLDYRSEDFPVATREFQRVLSLPIYSCLGDAEVERVIDAVGRALDEVPGSGASSGAPKGCS